MHAKAALPAYFLTDLSKFGHDGVIVFTIIDSFFCPEVSVFSFDTGIVYTSAGLLGVLLYMIAYLGLQTGQLRGGTVPHTSLNLMASSLVLVSLSQDFNLSAAIIQIIWLAISIFGLSRIYYLYKTTRLSADEAQFILAKMPQMTRPMARRFLDAGRWVDAAPGTVLAQEGEVLGALIYLAEGQAQVTSDGVEIATCEPGSLVGELTFLAGGPASATVVLSQPSRFFIVTRAALAQRLRRDSHFELFLEQALSREARQKLLATNLKARASGPLPSPGT